MKYFAYSILGLFVFLSVLFISTYVGSTMGPGPYDVGFCGKLNIYTLLCYGYMYNDHC